jgi:hypothetical protein
MAVLCSVRLAHAIERGLISFILTVAYLIVL